MNLTKADLIAISDQRVEDARALMNAECWDAAHYIAGYAVETMIKAVFAAGVAAEQFPDKARVDQIWQHKFKDLIVAAGLKDALATKINESSAFLTSWELCLAWAPQDRYNIPGTKSAAQARILLSAMTDHSDGVLTWLKTLLPATILPPAPSSFASSAKAP